MGLNIYTLKLQDNWVCTVNALALFHTRTNFKASLSFSKDHNTKTKIESIKRVLILNDFSPDFENFF